MTFVIALPGGTIRFIVDLGSKPMPETRGLQVYKISTAIPGLLLDDKVYIGTGGVEP